MYAKPPQHFLQDSLTIHYLYTGGRSHGHRWIRLVLVPSRLSADSHLSKAMGSRSDQPPSRAGQWDRLRQHRHERSIQLENFPIGILRVEDLGRKCCSMTFSPSPSNTPSQAVIVWWGNCIPLFGFTFMAPTIVHDLGYSAANAQLLTVPVYTLGVISTVFFSWLSDRRRTRWLFIVIPYTIAAVGFLGLLAVPQPRFPGLTYALLFFIPAGIYPGLIGILSWIGNNLAPSWKRAIGMGLLISLGNTGGLIGSNIFQEHQAPNYWLGYGFCFGILLAAIVSTIVLKGLMRGRIGSGRAGRKRM